MNRTIIVLWVLAINACATVIPANWNDTSGGSIGGVPFSITGLSSPFLGIEVRSYLSPDFLAAPLANVQAIAYGSGNDWTVTFGTALTDLFIYVDLWRGPYTSPGPDPTTNYDFSKPFQILSGMSGAGVTGNTLSLPFGPFYNGILLFSGPITSLSVVSSGGPQGLRDRARS